MIPLNPIKYINGLLIDLDNFDKIINSYNPVIFDFIKKLDNYITEKYGDNGQLLSNILNQSIQNKSLDKVLLLLLNKSELNVFGNKDFIKTDLTSKDAVTVSSKLKDTIDNDLPKKIYLKIFLQIMYKIVYSGVDPIYNRAKITNIKNNTCTLVTYDKDTNVQIENDNLYIFENDYDEMINNDIELIKKSSNVSIHYENSISYIVKYFENSEIGSYVGCDKINYYNIFKTDLLTILSKINSENIYKKLKLNDLADNFTNTAEKIKRLVPQRNISTPSSRSATTPVVDQGTTTTSGITTSTPTVTPTSTPTGTPVLDQGTPIINQDSTTETTGTPTETPIKETGGKKNISKKNKTK
jgi:hypothetical protein